MSDLGLSVLAHGPAGSGKTTLGVNTSPLPILFIDAENASRFITRTKIKWDPTKEAPPKYDGTWEVCVVRLREWTTVKHIYNYLKSGKHDFRTVMVDSISEIQTKAKESVAGRGQLKTQDWGRLLQEMGFFLRDLRDLVAMDESALELIYLISTSKLINQGEKMPMLSKPYLEGSVAQIVPYLFDMTVFLKLTEELSDPSNPGSAKVEVQTMGTKTTQEYEAKSRPPNVPSVITNPNLSQVLYQLFPAEYMEAHPEQFAQQNQQAPPAEAPPAEESVDKETGEIAEEPAPKGSGLPAAPK